MPRPRRSPLIRWRRRPARKAQKICHCKNVSLGAIEGAIAGQGLSSVEEVRRATDATGGCGACTGRVEDLLAAAAQAPALPVLQAGSSPMAVVLTSKKACAVNPLKMSQPIGGALAFMGLRGAMPLLHGSQGCTSFGLVLFVRHFKEAIPLQTTAMSEVATVLGGYENVEQAVLNIHKRTKRRSSASAPPASPRPRATMWRAISA